MAVRHPNNAAYAATTRDITIRVQPRYLEDQSEPERRRFVWAYHVHIENNGKETVQLMTRHWRITDGTGNVHEVMGDGVVGEQPLLQPGQAFEYTSGTPLGTPSGFMSGSYGMETVGGEPFDAVVPTFSLDSPHQTGRVN